MEALQTSYEELSSKYEAEVALVRLEAQTQKDYEEGIKNLKAEKEEIIENLSRNINIMRKREKQILNELDQVFYSFEELKRRYETDIIYFQQQIESFRQRTEQKETTLSNRVKKGKLLREKNFSSLQQQVAKLQQQITAERKCHQEKSEEDLAILHNIRAENAVLLEETRQEMNILQEKVSSSQDDLQKADSRYKELLCRYETDIIHLQHQNESYRQRIKQQTIALSNREQLLQERTFCALKQQVRKLQQQINQERESHQQKSEEDEAMLHAIEAENAVLLEKTRQEVKILQEKVSSSQDELQTADGRYKELHCRYKTDITDLIQLTEQYQQQVTCLQNDLERASLDLSGSFQVISDLLRQQKDGPQEKEFPAKRILRGGAFWRTLFHDQESTEEIPGESGMEELDHPHTDTMQEAKALGEKMSHRSPRFNFELIGPHGRREAQQNQQGGFPPVQPNASHGEIGRLSSLQEMERAGRYEDHQRLAHLEAELEREREKSKGLQEEMEALQTSYEELSSKYEAEVALVRLEAQTQKDYEEGIKNLKAEKEEIIENLSRNINIMRKREKQILNELDQVFYSFEELKRRYETDIIYFQQQIESFSQRKEQKETTLSNRVKKGKLLREKNFSSLQQQVAKLQQQITAERKSHQEKSEEDLAILHNIRAENAVLLEETRQEMNILQEKVSSSQDDLQKADSRYKELLCRYETDIIHLQQQNESYRQRIKQQTIALSNREQLLQERTFCALKQQVRKLQQQINQERESHQQKSEEDEAMLHAIEAENAVLLEKTRQEVKILQEKVSSSQDELQTADGRYKELHCRYKTDITDLIQLTEQYQQQVTCLQNDLERASLDLSGSFQVISDLLRQQKDGPQEKEVSSLIQLDLVQVSSQEDSSEEALSGGPCSTDQESTEEIPGNLAWKSWTIHTLTPCRRGSPAEPARRVPPVQPNASHGEIGRLSSLQEMERAGRYEDHQRLAHLEAELEREREKSKGLQEEMEALQTSYEELSSKYEAEVALVRLEAQTQKDYEEGIKNLKAEKEEIIENLSRNINIMRKREKQILNELDQQVAKLQQQITAERKSHQEKSEEDLAILHNIRAENAVLLEETRQEMNILQEKVSSSQDDLQKADSRYKELLCRYETDIIHLQQQNESKLENCSSRSIRREKVINRNPRRTMLHAIEAENAVLLEKTRQEVKILQEKVSSSQDELQTADGRYKELHCRYKTDITDLIQLTEQYQQQVTCLQNDLERASLDLSGSFQVISDLLRQQKDGPQEKEVSSLIQLDLVQVSSQEDSSEEALSGGPCSTDQESTEEIPGESGMEELDHPHTDTMQEGKPSRTSKAGFPPVQPNASHGEIGRLSSLQEMERAGRYEDHQRLAHLEAELEREREKSKGLQEEMEALQTSYEELSSKYEAEVALVRLEAQTQKDYEEGIKNLKAEKEEIIENLSRNINIMRKREKQILNELDQVFYSFEELKRRYETDIIYFQQQIESFRQRTEQKETTLSNREKKGKLLREKNFSSLQQQVAKLQQQITAERKSHQEKSEEDLAILHNIRAENAVLLEETRQEMNILQEKVSSSQDDLQKADSRYKELLCRYETDIIHLQQQNESYRQRIKQQTIALSNREQLLQERTFCALKQQVRKLQQQINQERESHQQKSEEDEAMLHAIEAENAVLLEKTRQEVKILQEKVSSSQDELQTADGRYKELHCRYKTDITDLIQLTEQYQQQVTCLQNDLERASLDLSGSFQVISDLLRQQKDGPQEKEVSSLIQLDLVQVSSQEDSSEEALSGGPCSTDQESTEEIPGESGMEELDHPHTDTMQEGRASGIRLSPGWLRKALVPTPLFPPLSPFLSP
ncbi:golgin subfamily A member 4-like [Poeciliopsis prolifica]|uniref:golgin subfamily A member 4-like n=1 Tax=Poeciliopsis prolifica TaxID=188132 RepID=UPI002412FD16|nr:golgin subfamily A member 4-like [Poeciliopsis prolifica]